GSRAALLMQSQTVPPTSLFIRRNESSALVPYTTLFRSQVVDDAAQGWQQDRVARLPEHQRVGQVVDVLAGAGEMHEFHGRAQFRSEEHTSELQSRENLVCRLLLEKKNDT